MPKIKETFATPTKLVLCSVPIIGFKDMPVDCITDSGLGTDHSEDIVNDLINPIETNNCINNLGTYSHKELNILLENNKDQCNINNDNLNKDAINSLKNSNLQSVSEDMETVKDENTFINSFNKHLKERQDACTQHIKNNNNNNDDDAKGIPKITSIEKTNIDISNVIIGNQSSVKQDLIYVTDHKICYNHSSKSEKLNLESYDSNKHNDQLRTTEFQLNARVTETNSTSPIALSFKIPAIAIVENTTLNIKQINRKRDTINNVRKSNALETKGLPVKRNVSSGKLYEKFNFSAIKKQMKDNNTIDTNNENAIFSRSESKMKDTENQTARGTQENSNKNTNDNTKVLNYKDNYNPMIPIKNVNCNNTTGRSKDSLINNFSNQENTTPDTSILNTSVNIDTVLEDFLHNSSAVSADINDEWINSLLN